MQLPQNYERLNPQQRRTVRQEYQMRQDGKCHHCGGSLSDDPPTRIKSIRIDWRVFPPNFLKYPVHLHHCHKTGMTIGAVHAYCNAVLWQYYGE